MGVSQTDGSPQLFRDIAREAFRLPRLIRLLLRVPLLRDLPARMIAFGIRRVRVEGAEEPALS